MKKIAYIDIMPGEVLVRIQEGNLQDEVRDILLKADVPGTSLVIWSMDGKTTGRVVLTPSLYWSAKLSPSPIRRCIMGPPLEKVRDAMEEAGFKVLPWLGGN